MATLEDHGIDVPPGATGEVRTTCPRCSAARRKAHERCLAVNADKGTWDCKHCGWSGGVKTGADDYGTIPGVRQPRRFARPAYAPSHPDALDARARAWLTGDRHLTAAVIDAHRLESRQIWMPQAGREVATIAFPYFRDGAVINVKYRDGAKHFRMEKDAELLLYGLDDIDPARPLVWVEGEIDKLSCAVVGFTSCVSMPNGAPPPESRNPTGHFAPLDSAAATLEGIADHIIAVDNDAPGRGLQDELIRRIGVARCRVVAWPEGCKDANEVLVRHGAPALAACLDAARPVPVAGLFTPNDLADRLSDLYDHGMAGGVEPTCAPLAALYKVKPGALTVLTGIPGMGKTAWLDWLLVDLIVAHGWRFAICSPENQPLERHLGQLLQIATGKPFRRGPHPRMTATERDEARAWIDEYVTFVLPPDEDERGYALDRILELARVAIRRRGVTGVVIDPWNELEHSRPPGLREDEYLGQSLIAIKRFARAHKVHVWLVAHPRTLAKVEGAYPVPTLYDISGGSMWRNKADVGIVVHRESSDDRRPTQVYVQKVRFQPESGMPGMVELFYDPLTGRYNASGPVAYRREPTDPWDAEIAEVDDA